MLGFIRHGTWKRRIGAHPLSQSIKHRRRMQSQHPSMMGYQIPSNVHGEVGQYRKKDEVHMGVKRGKDKIL